jgi:hypothetical protein
MKLDGNFDNHATKGIGHEAHLSMKHIGGFLQSPLTPPPDKCSHCISLADTMVIIVSATINTKHNYTPCFVKSTPKQG